MSDLHPNAIIPKVVTNLYVRAFSTVIKFCEGTEDPDGYRALYGWRPGNDDRLIANFDDHPRIKFTLSGQRLPEWAKPAPYSYTTAAGAYQATESTWDDFTKACGPHNFSPSSQDEFAIWLFIECNALDAILAGDLTTALQKCSGRWASLPFATVNQPHRTLEFCKSIWFQNLQQTAPTPAPASALPAPAPAPATSPQPKKGFMMGIAEVIAMFGPTLMGLIPQLGKLFSSGTEVSTRNLQAAQIAVDTIVKGANAVNVQDAIEKMKVDAELTRDVTKAVLTEPTIMGILEVGGGVIAAREMNMKMQSADRPFWYNPAFWISLGLLAMPFMLLTDSLFVHPDKYTENLRTQIVTAVLLVIGIVGGYWLGSSIGSAKKDERAALTPS